jgi:hypothetical protein
MSSSKSTNFIKGCAFCNSRKLSWVGHTVDNCRVLAENICQHCHQKGHAISRCPVKFEEVKQVRERERRQRWEENQKVRQQEKVREAEAKVQAKAKSWAGIAAKSVSSEAAAKIAEEDRILKEQSEKNRAAETAKRAEEERVRKQAAKERWERNYVRRMREKYGLKEDFVVPSKHYWQPEIRLLKGDFWYFKVEGTTEDHAIAKEMREDNANCEHFRAYLEEKYFVNWLDRCERTEDDCVYLYKLRDEEERRQWDAADEREEQEREWSRQWQEEEEMKRMEEDEMKAKLASGKISRKQFIAWEMAKEEEEWEDQDNYHAEGLRIWEREESRQINFKKAEAEWKARKEAREK